MWWALALVIGGVIITMTAITKYHVWVFKRLYWNTGNVGDGLGYSTKLTLGLAWRPNCWAVGVIRSNHLDSHFLHISILPLTLRIHWKRSYGGRYI